MEINGPFNYEYKYKEIEDNLPNTGDKEIELRDLIELINKVTTEK